MDCRRESLHGSTPPPSEKINLGAIIATKRVPADSRDSERDSFGTALHPLLRGVTPPPRPCYTIARAMTYLHPDLLLQGYASGVFPMADSREAPDLFWVEPRQRAILPLAHFHMSRSLAKRLRSGEYSVTADRAFPQVLAGCADREATWINPAIETAVIALHARGQAHSIEVWSCNGTLVGGLYGVRLGRAFFGESMFSRKTDASKVALAWLVARLKVGGFTLLDCQFMTGHLASLGAIDVPRKSYLVALSAALSEGAPPADWSSLDALLPTPTDSDDVAASGKLITQLLGHTS